VQNAGACSIVQNALIFAFRGTPPPPAEKLSSCEELTCAVARGLLHYAGVPREDTR